MKKLRVGIASAGRFHLLDLARELDLLNVEVRFYSYVPRKRAQRFGLPPYSHVALFPFVFPLLAFRYFLPRFVPRSVDRIMCWALDVLTIVRMRRCDVFICMSGIFVHAPRFARWRYGAKIILHRGSMHILSQKKILAAVPKAEQVSAFTVRREILGYELADKIAIPSSHVMESFSAWPDLTDKLFIGLYGVDLEQFPLQTGPRPSELTVLFVGTWSFQKGADLLTYAMMGLDGVKLKHVGALGDAPFPRHPRFIHYDPVPQWELKRFYSAANVCTLPSRQDGFGVVLCQALASGLPIVCTDRTGGPDLARQGGIARLIRIIPAGDQEALRCALLEALDDGIRKPEMAGITQSERELLSWRHYAIGHLDVMKALLDDQKHSG